MLHINKEWIGNSHNSADELQKHYVEQKKPDTEDYSVWFHFYEVQEEAKLVYGVRYQNDGCFFGGGRLIGKGHRGLSRVMAIFLVLNICQNASDYHTRFVCFIVCHCILIKRYILKLFKLRYPAQLITNVYRVFMLNSLTWVLVLTTIAIVYWTLTWFFL